MRALTQIGNEDQRVSLARILCKAYEREKGDEQARKQLRMLARALEHHPATGPVLRDALVPVFGETQPLFRR